MDGEELVRQSLQISEEIADPTIQAYGWTHLGYALAGQEQLDEASIAYNRAITLRNAADDETRTLDALTGLVDIALDQGDGDAARTYVDQILTHLDDGSLTSSLMPQQIYEVCFRVLQANQDERVDDFSKQMQNVVDPSS